MLDARHIVFVARASGLTPDCFARSGFWSARGDVEDSAGWEGDDRARDPIGDDVTPEGDWPSGDGDSVLGDARGDPGGDPSQGDGGDTVGGGEPSPGDGGHTGDYVGSDILVAIRFHKIDRMPGLAGAFSADCLDDSGTLQQVSFHDPSDHHATLPCAFNTAINWDCTDEGDLLTVSEHETTGLTGTSCLDDDWSRWRCTGTVSSPTASIYCLVD